MALSEGVGARGYFYFCYFRHSSSIQRNAFIVAEPQCGGHVRFFFDFSVNGRMSPDTVGSEFDSIGAARSEAIRALMAIANDEAGDAASQAFRVTVRNDDLPVYTATLSFDGAD
jgi:hypothetical protein